MSCVNVVIFADSIRFKYSEIHNVVSTLLGTSLYCYHQLEEAHFLSHPWEDNCRLFISAHCNLTSVHKSKLLSYSSKGGAIISLGSTIHDFMSLDPTAAMPIQLTDRPGVFDSIKSSQVISLNLSSIPSHNTVTILSPGPGVAQAHIVRVDLGTARAIVCTVDLTQHTALLRVVLEELNMEMRPDELTKSSVLSLFSLKLSLGNFVDRLARGLLTGDTLKVCSPGEYCSFDVPGCLLASPSTDVLIHAPTCPSTQPILENFVDVCPPEWRVVVVANQQTAGKGRGNNQWLSPLGSALFSFSHRASTKSAIGRKPLFMQYVCAYAVVEATRRLSPALRLSIKWPNDVYFGGSKIGGVLVSSSFLADRVTFYCGIGVNVWNQSPSLSLNSIVPDCGVSIAPLIGTILDVFERTLEQIECDGMDSFVSLYYKQWLHSDAVVFLNEENCNVRIIGVDDNGFLKVTDEHRGVSYSLSPDGNSFDMLRNLIILK